MDFKNCNIEIIGNVNIKKKIFLALVNLTEYFFFQIKVMLCVCSKQIIENRLKFTSP